MSDSVREEVLDLREGGTLPPHLLRRLDELAMRDYAAFNRLIADLSRGRERNIDWWVGRPATRNNHCSALYRQCIQLALVRQLLDDGRRIVVAVDSPEMTRVLQRGGGPNLTVVVVNRWRAWLKRKRQILWDMASSIFHCASAALAGHLTRRFARPRSARPLIVVGTFVSRDSLAKGDFHDRYYPGLLEIISAEERETLYYLPIFYRLRHYLSTFRALRSGRANFLFREDYLCIADYAFAFGHWMRARSLLGVKAQFAGFDVGPLVDADLRAGRFASIVVRSLLAFRFLVNARRRGIHIQRILDWYEGLDLNHAIAAAVNWHCPEIQLIGFRSAGSLLYMSSVPAPHEVERGVVPRIMAVVGTKTADDIRAICPALHVVPAPGVRYQQFPAMRRRRSENVTAALLALPLFPDLAGDAIGTMEAALQFRPNGPSCWWLKCHPALPQAKVLAAFGRALPEGFAFVDGDFYDLLMRATVVISVASSVLIEAVALGIPTICLAARNMPTEIPIPSWVDQRLWRVAYDAQEAADAVMALTCQPPFPVDCASLQDALLSPADRSSIRRLLGLHAVAADG